jgi:ABC-2 type transport system ATP-binding protein
MEEADRICDRIAIIDHGKIVRIGTPAEIKRIVGNDVIEFTLDLGSDEISQMVSEHTGAKVERNGANYRVKVDRGEEAIPTIIELVASKGYLVKKVSLSKPSLSEAYLELTGRAFREADQEAVQTARLINFFG